MPVEKILNNIKAKIAEITPSFQAFSDQSIQPGVEDCARLQQQLFELMDQLSVYKYNKLNYELSPSFNLHARISDTAEPVKQEAVPPPESRPDEPEKKAPAEKQPETSQPKNGGSKNARSLYIGLNDKFRFINELFARNNAEYNIAVEQLSNLQTWNESDIYLNSLKNLYGWKENHDAVKYFYSIVKKRFQ